MALKVVHPAGMDFDIIKNELGSIQVMI